MNGKAVRSGGGKLVVPISVRVLLMWRVVLLLQVTAALARRPPAPPIGAEEVRHISRAAECQFGKTVRELGSTWFADLGPPFGVMYCIKCECVAIHKKRRIVGKVLCRNIKHECPEPTCEEPVLLPGRCCKSCPPHGQDVDLVQDAVQPPPEDDDKNYKYYASVLAGDGQSATARFTFTKKSLFYSLYSTSRPQLVQFLDRQGNILEEQEVGDGTLYENATDKLCGVWRRIPKDYRKLLREDGLSVSLVWPTMAMTGHILRYAELATEEQSALLTGEKPGSSGTAIISVSTATPSVHIVLIFTGLFTGGDTANAPVHLRLHNQEGKDVLEEVIKVDKASPELNTISTSSPVTIHDLRLLVRSKLYITLTSKNSNIEISGAVRPRVACEIFQGLMTGERGSGLLSAFINRNGDFVYKSYFNGVHTPAIISLEFADKKIEELSSEKTESEKTSPRLVEGLYSNQLAASVPGLTGRLQGKPAAPPRASLTSLLLLPSSGMVSLANLAGAISIAVDPQCNLYYEAEITVSGDYCIWLSHVPLIAPGAPVTSRLVDCGQGARLEGSLLTLLPAEIQLIDSGVITVQVRDNVTDSVLLAANWEQKEIPRTCLPQTVSGDGFRSDAASGPVVITAAACYHRGVFHSDGEQWRDPTDPCTVCSCSLGTLSCQTQCINNTGGIDDPVKGCQMAGQFFPAGATWHPYLPPNGFDICTVCTCSAETLKVSCPRTICPPLECDERIAIRPDKKSCCRVCPVTPPRQISVEKERIEEEEEKADILSNGGCEYPMGGPFRNGQEWHPRLYSGGEIKCVICKCLEGSVKCERKRCNRAACHDECCVAQCKRRRRFAKRKH